MAELPADYLRRLHTRLARAVHVEAGGCWLWRGRTLDGYGQIQVRGRTIRVHQAVYFLARGRYPAGLVLDHLCRIRVCCNPEHLEPVTSAENSRRGRVGEASRERQSSRHACIRGHSLLDPANVYSKRPGIRECRACHRFRECYRKHRLRGQEPCPRCRRELDADDARHSTLAL